MPEPNRSNPGQGSGPPRYPGTFLLAFREAMGQMNWQVRRWLGLAAECVDAQGREHVIGLENLFRRLRREERHTWPGLIVDFLGQVATEQWENPPANLNEVADRLLVRLGAPFREKRGEFQVWFQPLVGKDFGLTLVIDYPQSMSYVTEQQIEESGRSAEDWCQKALANLLTHTPPDCLEIVDEESGLRQCAIGDAYDASRALLLDQILPGQEDGYFVALPSRDQFLVLPVHAPALNYIHLLKAIALKTFQTAPYAITGEIFWLREKVWRLFPLEIGKDQITAHPPEEFLEVLQRLEKHSKNDPDGSGQGNENPPAPTD